MKRLVVLLGIFLVMAGCTSMSPIEYPPVEVWDRVLEIGNKVRVTTKTGDQYRFKVTTLSQDSIGGDEVQVSIDDIALIEVREFDADRSATVGMRSLGAIFLSVAVGTLVFFVVVF